MKTFHANDDTLAKINKVIDPRLKNDKPTGQYKNGKEIMLKYLSGITVIDMLNDTFGTFGWSYEIIDTWIEKSQPFFQKENEKYPLDDSKVSVAHNEYGQRGLVLKQNSVCNAKCRLTVHFYDQAGEYRSVVKEAFGSKTVVGKSSEQESIFKSAQTDALKKAASLFGIGAELYRNEEENAVFIENNRKFIWTEELIAKHPGKWNYIENTLVLNEWNYESLAYWVSMVTNGQETDIFYMPESKIDEFMKAFKADVESNTEGAE